MKAVLDHYVFKNNKYIINFDLFIWYFCLPNFTATTILP